MTKTIEKPVIPQDRRTRRAATIARKIAQLRREHGLSQDALGNLVNASQATVSRWEDPESLSTPSALELADIAEHFRVDVSWILGTRDHRESLPVGHAIMDQSLLEAFGSCTTSEELKGLLARDMTFGTIWVQIPTRAEVVSIEEALRRVKEVDRHVRRVHPQLWHEWAGIVLS